MGERGAFAEAGRKRGTGWGSGGAYVGRVLVLVALVLVSGACGPTGGDDQAETVTVIETVPADEGSGRVAEGGLELALGNTFTTSGAGNEMTVLSYESPLSPAGASRPNPGFEFSAVEIEGCTSRDPNNYRMLVGPASFSLQMPDGARVQPEAGRDATRVTERALETMEPVLGGCERGLVVFQTPEGERPEVVLFDDQFTTDAMNARWTIPDE